MNICRTKRALWGVAVGTFLISTVAPVSAGTPVRPSQLNLGTVVGSNGEAIATGTGQDKSKDKPGVTFLKGDHPLDWSKLGHLGDGNQHPSSPS